MILPTTRSIDEQKEILNRFYFDEFAAELPPALRELALDPLVLFHREVETPLKEVTQQVRLEYWLTPWLLADIFDADEEAVATVGKAFLLIFLAYLVLDHLVDGQTPDHPLIPLLTHEFYFAAAKELRKVLSHDDSFWEAYYASIKSHADALSIEYQSVSQVNPPFSYERMQTVAVGKAMPFRVAAEALGRLSQKADLIPMVSQVYFYHMFADQFYDDADDYLDDWQIKRATMAMVYLAEGENMPVKDVFALETAFLRDKVIEHRVREKMVNHSSSLLSEGLALIPQNLHDTRLYQLLAHRLEMDKVIIKSFRAVGFMRRLKNSLK